MKTKIDSNAFSLVELFLNRSFEDNSSQSYAYSYKKDLLGVKKMLIFFYQSAKVKYIATKFSRQSD